MQQQACLPACSSSTATALLKHQHATAEWAHCVKAIFLQRDFFAGPFNLKVAYNHVILIKNFKCFHSLDYHEISFSLQIIT